jgi:predicted hotdog family 3-hydroxylacyl-ACP dehydratase
MFTTNAQERIAELERRLADAQARLPRHSTPMVMMMEVEELEDALAQARAQVLVQEKHDAASDS